MSQRTSGVPVLSLFCGCGGMDLGFEAAGFRPVLAIDVDQPACDTYAWNRPERPDSALCADLSKISPDEIVERLPEDVRGVIGGPPCQAFSVSNVVFGFRTKRHAEQLELSKEPFGDALGDQSARSA